MIKKVVSICLFVVICFGVSAFYNPIDVASYSVPETVYADPGS